MSSPRNYLDATLSHPICVWRSNRSAQNENISFAKWPIIIIDYDMSYCCDWEKKLTFQVHSLSNDETISSSTSSLDFYSLWFMSFSHLFLLLRNSRQKNDFDHVCVDVLYYHYMIAFAELSCSKSIIIIVHLIHLRGCGILSGSEQCAVSISNCFLLWMERASGDGEMVQALKISTFNKLKFKRFYCALLLLWKCRDAQSTCLLLLLHTISLRSNLSNSTRNSFRVKSLIGK